MDDDFLIFGKKVWGKGAPWSWGSASARRLDGPGSNHAYSSSFFCSFRRLWREYWKIDGFNREYAEFLKKERERKMTRLKLGQSGTGNLFINNISVKHLIIRNLPNKKRGPLQGANIKQKLWKNAISLQKMEKNLHWGIKARLAQRKNGYFVKWLCNRARFKTAGRCF